MTTQHTELPWHMNGNTLIRSELFLVAAAEFADMSTDDAHANAEFICLACNSHDALLAACKGIRDWASDTGAMDDDEPQRRAIIDAIAKVEP